MKVEVGKIYQCGDNKVLIVADLYGNPLHNPKFYSIIGVVVGNNGTLGCLTGMFGKDGGYHIHNPYELEDDLKELPDELTTLKLERIAKIEEELAQLKLDLQKDK